MNTAILVDAAFFLSRLRSFYPNDYRNPELAAERLCQMCLEHINDGDLYRILVYDCSPLDQKARHPITGNEVDFLQLPQSQFRMEFHRHLKSKRKVALRLGELRRGEWILKDHATKKLLTRKMELDDLQRSHVKLDIKQKGVDMKLGIDIASMALKRMVDRIVLVSGDGDFVPAAKLARREGIDVILDPMGAHIGKALHEHNDGIISPWADSRQLTTAYTPPA